jgi:hypothetical protein
MGRFLGRSLASAPSVAALRNYVADTLMSDPLWYAERGILDDSESPAFSADEYANAFR